MDAEGDDVLVFAEEAEMPEAVATDGEAATPWRVLVVDDEPDVQAITRAALAGCVFRNRPIKVLGAATAAEARALLLKHPDIAVVLLDVVMETDDAGLRLVLAIREELRRHAVRIILRTGQPGLAAEYDIIIRYDINDYRLKTELTARSLFTTVIAALRGYTEILARSQAEEAAVLANRAKSEFLDNINHELRTPLNAIIGLADLMDNEVFGPLANDTYRGFVRDIIVSGQALNETLGAILDMANVEFTNFKLRLEALDVANLFQRVVKPMAPQAARAGVMLIEEVPEGLRVWGDGRRLRQLLFNLVSNAIRFNRRGGVVALIGEATGDGQVVITVRDTGIGMTEDELAVALTPFGQVDGGMARHRDGAGLGLPLAKMIADRHGGRLDISSVPGRGTTVCVKLSAVQAEQSGSPLLIRR